MVTDEHASATLVNHVIKSGGRQRYKNSKSFFSSCKDILDYYHVSYKAPYNYSKMFLIEITDYKTDGLINEILKGETNGRHYNKR